MKTCETDFAIPRELLGQDVYDMFFIFQNEDEALKYIVKEYNIDKTLFVTELHEEDFMREGFGREHYLRSVSISISIQLTELETGEYILWEAY